MTDKGRSRVDIKTSEDAEDEMNEKYMKSLKVLANVIENPLEKLVPSTANYAKSRQNLVRFLYSTLMNVCIVLLASVDAIILVVMLLVEIEALKLPEGSQRNYFRTIRFGLECTSLSIISLFMVELMCKMFAMGPQHFCKEWIEVTDVMVTAVSILIDALLIADHLQRHHPMEHSLSTHDFNAIGAAGGLLIVFRLWRVIQIINATSVSLNTVHAKKLIHLGIENDKLRRRIYQLSHRLRKHNIPLPVNLDKSGKEEEEKVVIFTDSVQFLTTTTA